MSLKKNIRWIKIVVDLFDDEKIKLIEALPDRDAILVIWFKILTLAGKSNAGGFLVLSDRIPYSDEMLSTVFNRPLNTVRLALRTFQEFGMIELTEERTIQISRWNSYQSIDTDERYRELTRKRVLRHREKEKQKLSAKNGNVTHVTVTQSPAVSRTNSAVSRTNTVTKTDQCNVTETLPYQETHHRSHSQAYEEDDSVTLQERYCNAPPLIENKALEKEVKTETEIKTETKEERESNGKKFDSPETASKRPQPVSLPLLANLWNSLCPNLPEVTAISKKRLYKEKLRLREHDPDWWKTVFERLNKSNFCAGENDRGWKATYDWVLDSEDNALKVLEGKYDNAQRSKRGAGGDDPPHRERGSPFPEQNYREGLNPDGSVDAEWYENLKETLRVKNGGIT